MHVCAVMTDNGSCYVAHAYCAPLRELGLKQLRIRLGRPRTNGKAERFIQTLLNEWAYARVYGSSADRTAALPLSSSATTTGDHAAASATGLTAEQRRWELQLAARRAQAQRRRAKGRAVGEMTAARSHDSTRSPHDQLQRVAWHPFLVELSGLGEAAEGLEELLAP